MVFTVHGGDLRRLVHASFLGLLLACRRRAGPMANCEAFMHYVHVHQPPGGTIVVGVLIGIPALSVLTVLVLWIKYRINNRAR
jgi:hypothetical protein